MIPPSVYVWLAARNLRFPTHTLIKFPSHTHGLLRPTLHEILILTSSSTSIPRLIRPDHQGYHHNESIDLFPNGSSPYLDMDAFERMSKSDILEYVGDIVYSDMLVVF